MKQRPKLKTLIYLSIYFFVFTNFLIIFFPLNLHLNFALVKRVLSDQKSTLVKILPNPPKNFVVPVISAPLCFLLSTGLQYQKLLLD